jgi:hypothetical protein
MNLTQRLAIGRPDDTGKNLPPAPQLALDVRQHIHIRKHRIGEGGCKRSSAGDEGLPLDRFAEAVRLLCSVLKMKKLYGASPRLVAALLLCAVSACHTVQPIQPSQLSSKAIYRVWITKANDSAIVLADPQLRGDTLAGFVNGAYQEMALSEVRSLRAREPAYGRTALLAGALTAAAVAGLMYFENRSYVGGGEACSGDITQQQANLHCNGLGDARGR